MSADAWAAPVPVPQVVTVWTREPPEPWMDDAVCAQTDPEAFFPEKGGSTRAAKKLCKSCDVAEQCLRYALERQERFGIWGGLSERERRRLSDGHEQRAEAARASWAVRRARMAAAA